MKKFLHYVFAITAVIGMTASASYAATPINPPAAVVPEPGTGILIGLGLLGAAYKLRRNGK